MTEKLQIIDGNKYPLLYMAFWHSIESNEVFAILREEAETPPFEVDVKLAVNGHDIPVAKSFKAIEDAIDEMVLRKAAEMVMDKFSSAVAIADELRGTIANTQEEVVRKICSELGIDSENILHY